MNQYIDRVYQDLKDITKQCKNCKLDYFKEEMNDNTICKYCKANPRWFK